MLDERKKGEIKKVELEIGFPLRLPPFGGIRRPQRNKNKNRKTGMMD
jgi:hypothetical protein